MRFEKKLVLKNFSAKKKLTECEQGSLVQEVLILPKNNPKVWWLNKERDSPKSEKVELLNIWVALTEIHWVECLTHSMYIGQ